MDNSLNGYNVLIVEDEPLVALDLTETLTRAGAHVVAAHSIAQAVAAIEKIKVRAAVLDIGLHGENCASLCQYLSQRGVQFLFYSGYTLAPNEWDHITVIRKPASGDDIVNAVGLLCASRQRAA